jgi:hypothetical protein
VPESPQGAKEVDCIAAWHRKESDDTIAVSAEEEKRRDNVGEYR